MLRRARFIYLAGSSPLHVRSVLKSSRVWNALLAAWEDGAVVAGSSGAAMALTDPMVDARGGGLTIGLGLVSGVAVVPHFGDTRGRPRREDAPRGPPRPGRHPGGRSPGADCPHSRARRDVAGGGRAAGRGLPGRCRGGRGARAKTPKISEGILQAIYKSLDNEHQSLIDLQAFSGERVHCICTINACQIKSFNREYAIISVKPFQTKARIEHPSIIPNTVADRVLRIARQAGRDTPFPNYNSLWRDITKLAFDKFNVRLTSHYLRKRFFSIADKTSMPTNHWDLLMGSQKQTGHCAENYSLEDYSELVDEYDRYLSNPLDLSTTHQEPEPVKSTSLDRLLKENAELKEQLTKLIKLLTEGSVKSSSG